MVYKSIDHRKLRSICYINNGFCIITVNYFPRIRCGKWLIDKHMACVYLSTTSYGPAMRRVGLIKVVFRILGKVNQPDDCCIACPWAGALVNSGKISSSAM